MYGTLKRGFYNHRLLQEREAKFVGNASTREPMRLVLGEYGIPYLMKGEGNTAVPGELWEVDDAGLDALDVLEGIDEGMYERVTMDVSLMDDGGGRDETMPTTSAQAYVCGPESDPCVRHDGTRGGVRAQARARGGIVGHQVPRARLWLNFL